MSSKSRRSSTVRLTDWQIFTNNGNFNNPLPPSRRLKKRNPYFVLKIDPNYVRDRCRTTRSRNQSAVSTSTRRILSARSITYRRPPRVKPIDLDLDETCDEISVYYSTRSKTGRRTSTTSSQLWAPPAWSFSYLHRAIIAIDEQAKKDYEVGRTMNALAAWQNALIFCDELSQRTPLWPENKAALDEEIARLRRAYKQHMDEITKKSKNIRPKNTFLVPTRKCTYCLIEQPPDQFHERFSNDCQHVERTICNKCMYHMVKSLLETSKTTEINCPEPHCTGKFNLTQIREMLSSVHKIESIENLSNPSNNDPSERKTEFIWCAHEECGSGQFHIMNPDTAPIVTCVLCKQQTCAVHHVPWHNDMTCNEYDQQQQQQQQQHQHQAPVIEVKQCVKCHSNIEENPGSDRVICSKCKFEYCWECMVDYKQIQKKGPRHHKTTCSHYEDKSKKSRACTIL